MNQSPLVTVAMPVYNGVPWLEESLESLLAQTWANMEIVISDNASTDRTEAICREYMARDGRISYHRNAKNLGVMTNFSVAFGYARGQYFKWVSVSDLCRPTFVEQCVRVLETREDAVLCYPGTLFIDEDGKEGERCADRLDLQEESASARALRLLDSIRLANALFGVFRTDALRRSALLRRHMASDINLLFEMSLYGKFVELPEPLFLRRMGEKTTTTQRGREAMETYIQPERTRPMLWQSWRYHLAYIGDTLRAPIPARDKRIILQRLLREMIWARGHLSADVVDAVKVALGMRR